tara:strand:+ start:568 stop:1275 length:708 start_codon:yes stop_codon:yes gene_type:complete
MSDQDELSFDEEEQKFLDTINEDSEFKIILKFGYSVDINDKTEIRFEIKDEKINDQGLIAGLTQNDQLVDAFFLGNKFSKKNNLTFNPDFIEANGKKYKYDDLILHMTDIGAFVVSKDENDLIVSLNDDAYQMFSSVVGLKNNDSCVISVIDSELSACYISNGEIIWTKPINIGKNKFDVNTGIINCSKRQVNITECYLRGCVKNIYLHVDVSNPPSTLILGKLENPFFDMKQNV